MISLALKTFQFFLLSNEIVSSQWWREPWPCVALVCISRSSAQRWKRGCRTSFRLRQLESWIFLSFFIYSAEVDCCMKGALSLLLLPTLFFLSRSTSGCSASCPAQEWITWEMSSESLSRWGLSVTPGFFSSPLLSYESISLCQKWKWSPNLETSLAMLFLSRHSLL